jgi:hypothetical protein
MWLDSDLTVWGIGVPEDRPVSEVMGSLLTHTNPVHFGVGGQPYSSCIWYKYRLQAHFH